MRRSWLLWCFVLSFAFLPALADGGPAFDLDGPRIDAKVTRNGKILPIGSVASAGGRATAYGSIPIFQKKGCTLHAGGRLSHAVR